MGRQFSLTCYAACGERRQAATRMRAERGLDHMVRSRTSGLYGSRLLANKTPEAASSRKQQLWRQLGRGAAGSGAKNEASMWQPKATRQRSRQKSIDEQCRPLCSLCGVAAILQCETACAASGAARACCEDCASEVRCVAWCAGRVRAESVPCAAGLAMVRKTHLSSILFLKRKFF